MVLYVVVGEEEDGKNAEVAWRGRSTLSFKPNPSIYLSTYVLLKMWFSGRMYCCRVASTGKPTQMPLDLQPTARHKTQKEPSFILLILLGSFSATPLFLVPGPK